MATDNGHRSGAPRDGNQWALGEWERVVDFGHRGQTIATVAGKAAVRAFYGQGPKYSYFYGCSQGGQKAMLIAQRFPHDYDGILAGAPVFSWADEMTMQAWTVRAFTETEGSRLSIEQINAIGDAVIAQCGDSNGLVTKPSVCDFDPDQLRCPQSDGKACLSEEQVTAVRKVYLGPHTSSGERILGGYARGSERGWGQLYANVSADGTEGGGSWLGVYRYMVFEDPSWNLLRMDFDKDPARAKRKLGPVMDADSPDLDAFAKRGGKLLMYQGWADQQIPAEEAVRYHAEMIERYGSARSSDFFRLFMIPGMPHCAPEVVSAASPAARGPNFVPYAEYDATIKVTPENDALTALQDWVEKGRPPRQFLVRLRNDDFDLKPLTVRVCAEPQKAVYRGAGDPKDGLTWECRETPGTSD